MGGRLVPSIIPVLMASSITHPPIHPTLRRGLTLPTLIIVAKYMPPLPGTCKTPPRHYVRSVKPGRPTECRGQESCAIILGGSVIPSTTTTTFTGALGGLIRKPAPYIIPRIFGFSFASRPFLAPDPHVDRARELWISAVRLMQLSSR